MSQQKERKKYKTKRNIGTPRYTWKLKREACQGTEKRKKNKIDEKKKQKTKARIVSVRGYG